MAGWATCWRRGREAPDAAAHLGDVSRDAEALAAACPDLPLWSVSGNCDGWGASAPDELEATLGGVKFLFTHGHRYRVKLGPGCAPGGQGAGHRLPVLWAHP